MKRGFDWACTFAPSPTDPRHGPPPQGRHWRQRPRRRRGHWPLLRPPPPGSRKERTAARAAVALAPLDAVPSRKEQLDALRRSGAGATAAAGAPGASASAAALSARAATEAALSSSPADGQNGPAPKVVGAPTSADEFELPAVCAASPPPLPRPPPHPPPAAAVPRRAPRRCARP
ncbi:hypothetical protein BU14_0295s0012 [Porphyra umbilicalis]|uniref:Uncharacterized protein n=1 Tax=Porphyra umbilicalis TaxID=2786 RepID=A0A1X6P0C4_PORUM|nr:hypothetical protein BU14_0295s0012 [Porphyra umbilicalis]|eukprot:OSX74308.1 hypothetical protein BU14_0295s0012 [Porphyra umbilicalis]